MTWMDISRQLRAAGWRHTVYHVAPERDQNGAPWDEGCIEHRWIREDAALTVYKEWTEDGAGKFLTDLCYWPIAGDSQWVVVTPELAKTKGSNWLYWMMVAAGILPPLRILLRPTMSDAEVAELTERFKEKVTRPHRIVVSPQERSEL